MRFAKRRRNNRMSGWRRGGPSLAPWRSHTPERPQLNDGEVEHADHPAWRHWPLPRSCCSRRAAAAQDAPRGLVEVHDRGRHGFWGALGVGAGGEAFDLRDGAGYSGDLYRPTISVRLGGTPSQYLRLGGELQGWIDDQGDRTESLTSILFIGQFYPAPATGLYLKGGLGLGPERGRFRRRFRRGRHRVRGPGGRGVGGPGGPAAVPEPRRRPRPAPLHRARRRPVPGADRELRNRRPLPVRTLTKYRGWDWVPVP